MHQYGAAIALMLVSAYQREPFPTLVREFLRTGSIMAQILTSLLGETLIS